MIYRTSELPQHVCAPQVWTIKASFNIVFLSLPPIHSPIQQPPTMVKTIDHTFHPFIMDEIIKYSSMYALFKLRLTSTSFLARVDNVLASHVFLGGTTSDIDTNPTRYLPKKLRFTPGSTTWSLDASPSTIRILDIDDELLSNADLGRFLRRFTGITTLRRYRREAFITEWTPPPRRRRAVKGNLRLLPPSTDTVVDFIPFSVLLPNPPIHLVGSSRHIVFLRVEDRSSGDMVPLRFTFNGDLDHVVFVLWPSYKTGTVEPREDTLDAIVITLTRLLRTTARRVTVVGLERVIDIDDSSMSESDEVTTLGKEAFGIKAQLRHLRQELGSDVVLKFLKLEEWRDEQQEEEKTLLGVWPDEYDNGVSCHERRP